MVVVEFFLGGVGDCLCFCFPRASGSVRVSARESLAPDVRGTDGTLPRSRAPLNSSSLASLWRPSSAPRQPDIRRDTHRER